MLGLEINLYVLFQFCILAVPSGLRAPEFVVETYSQTEGGRGGVMILVLI